VRFLWRFLLSVLSGRWDVVWFQHRLLAPLAGVVRLLTRARIMIWVFGWEVWSPPSTLSRICMGMADRVLSISTFTARKCESLYRIPPDRMRVCPLGVSQRLHTLSGDPVAGIPEGPFVLVVSRLVLPDAERKGVLRVCEAMVKVIEQVPAASCVVVGEGPARLDIQDRVRNLGLAERIVFTGRLSDAQLRWLYRKASVFALPSTVEGFGLVYVEAMVNRVPVVAGRLDATVDVVEDGRTGLLVDPMNVAEIARAVVTLLKDDAFRGIMGTEGYERVQKHFTEEAMGHRLMAVLKEMER
jgi:glycosyltransferase involved in cell wall biosynthesis